MISLDYSFSGALLVSLFIISVIRAVVRRLQTHSISHLPGPPPGSWFVGNSHNPIGLALKLINLSIGNLPELIRPDNLAEAEFAWANEHGTAVRIKGALGVCPCSDTWCF